MAAALAQGFADPVLDAQNVFRAVLNALAEPGRPVAVRGVPHAPAPLSPMLAALALTLLDHETPVWLDRALSTGAVTQWLAFQCGCPVVTEPAAAAFALVSDPELMPPLGLFALGTDAYPDRSTTVLIATAKTAQRLMLSGPGIDQSLRAALPVRPSLVAEWAENRALFPRGVDMVIAGEGEVTGLPRSTKMARV